jgi:hypothetical protein
MSAPTLVPADLAAECLCGGVRRLIGGVHSWTAARVVVVCVDSQWVRVRFSSDPGRLPVPWEVDEQFGWWRACRDAVPGLRDASADPVLVVVGVGESQVVAVNLLAIDEIGVTCHGGGQLVGSWVMQAKLQGCSADAGSVAGVRISDSPDATVVVADPLVDGGSAGWVDVLSGGTSWPVRPLRGLRDSETAGGATILDASDVVGGSSGRDADGLCDGSEPTIGTGPPDAAGSAGGAWMKVFGGFEVTDTDGAVLQPLQQQIIGVIAMRGPIPTSALCKLVYGTERQKSFHVAMSKIRRRGLQPELTEQGYRIDIDSQWRRFTDRVGTDPANAETAALAQAATMVTTPLFGADPPDWALPHLPEMGQLICQVCRELAARHADDPQTALAYAQLGLDVDPSQRELAEIVAMLKAGSWDLGPGKEAAEIDD